jgi:hypothetical protein
MERNVNRVSQECLQPFLLQDLQLLLVMAHHGPLLPGHRHLIHQKLSWQNSRIPELVKSVVAVAVCHFGAPSL